MKYELQFTVKHELVFEASDIEQAGKVANEYVTRNKGVILSVIPFHIVQKEKDDALRESGAAKSPETPVGGGAELPDNTAA